jgi:hypothetical protein
MADITGAPRVVTDDIEEKRDVETQQIENAFTGKMLDEDARLGAEREHSMTLWEGLKIHRKAVGWSVLVSATIIMEGVCLISSPYP